MALDSIHRCIAVDVWSKYQDAPDSHDGLEQALGGFDMFVLHDQPQDLDYVCGSVPYLSGYEVFFSSNTSHLLTRLVHPWTT